MTKSALQFGAAVVMACAALFVLTSIASTTTTTFTGAGAGCVNSTPGDPISGDPISSVSRNRTAPRVSRMTE